jgi:hypothetical protein
VWVRSSFELDARVGGCARFDPFSTGVPALAVTRSREKRFLSELVTPYKFSTGVPALAVTRSP